MSLEITPIETDELRSFLGEMDRQTQERGEEYFRRGAVRTLWKKNPDSFSAIVQGSRLYSVTLSLDPDEGWDYKCSCPLEKECKHVYATGLALLAQNQAPPVDRPKLSPPAPAEGLRPPAAGTFSNEVEQSLGRQLTTHELRFVEQLLLMANRCRARNFITRSDFVSIGFSLTGRPNPQDWKTIPNSLREFWQKVAMTVSAQGLTIPTFLEPISDLPRLRARLERAQRLKEIQQWKQDLGQAHPRSSELAPQFVREAGLRLRLGPKGARLEWLLPGQEGFSPMTSMQVLQLEKEMTDGLVRLSPDSEWIWEAVQPNLMYGPRAEFDYDDSFKKSLSRLFAFPHVHSRLVNEKGHPFHFPEKPIEWKLKVPADGEGDYFLRLEQNNGESVPAIFMVLNGFPSLYLTEEAVFRGPSIRHRFLNAMEVIKIPAPALETRGGVALLHSLGLELPPRLKNRVRIVPLCLKFKAEITPAYFARSREICKITPIGEAPDESGRWLWNGYDWKQETSPGGEKTKGAREEHDIIFHDRSALRDPSSLLGVLDARWEHYLHSFSVKVTKKFPEIFSAWLQSLPPDVKIDLPDELASLAEKPLTGSVRLEATETEIDWFDLRVVIDVGDTTLSPAELQLLLNARGNYVRLEGKGWRRLKFDLNQEDDERLARLGLTPRELSGEPMKLHALQLADESAKRFLPEPQVERIQRRAAEIKTRVTPEIPASVTAELRPYQKEGFHFLAYLATNHFGGILADDMGLGKTLQALTWLEWLRHTSKAERETGSSHLKSNGNGEQKNSILVKPAETEKEGVARPFLVVCPKSVMDNWRAEAERFAPALRVKVWSPGELAQLPNRAGEADLHVLNYAQLRIAGEFLIPILWGAIILDEGQYIKNPSSITAQIAQKLRTSYRLILSGTPIENRLLDLWSLMNFAMPGALGSRAQFSRLYDGKEDPLARRRLSARVRPFLLRRTKSQVAKDLPERIEEDLFCEIEGEQKTLYRAELKRAQQMLLRVQTQKQLAKERFHFLTSLLRLRQICCHPKLVKPDSNGSSAKLEALLEQLEPLIEEGHKVLVFSQFVEMLKLLKPEMEKRGWPYFYLAGETENRGELVRDFQAAKGAAVFLISLKAGGFGLNLTAANYVVLFDPWWNPAVENQAIDRTHRIGQKSNVIAYRLLIKNSIEEKIRTLQKGKSALAADVLGEEKFAQSLTLEDLHYLFSD